MRFFLFLHLVSLLLHFVMAGLFTGAKKQAKIDKFKACKGHEKDPMVMRDEQIKNINGTMFISANIYVSKDIPNNLKLETQFTRCKSKDNLNSCENAPPLSLNHLCGMLNQKNPPWASFTESIHPPFKCPLKKGVYSVKNATIAGALLNTFPFGDYYWRSISTFRSGATNEVFFCVLLEIRVV